MLSAICFNLDKSKILWSGNGLINHSILYIVFLSHLILTKGEILDKSKLKAIADDKGIPKLMTENTLYRDESILGK